MDKTEIYQLLNYVNHSREKRMEMAQWVSNDPSSIGELFKIALENEDPISSRACWVLEFTAKENISIIFSYLDTITSHLSDINLDSSVRPMAKICEYLTTFYFSKIKNNVQDTLTEIHLERITTACFDWLIGDHKVAAKAYSMSSLYLLGLKFHWIHPELKMILEQNYAHGSAAYKARARMVLSKIKKLNE